MKPRFQFSLLTLLAIVLVLGVGICVMKYLGGRSEITVITPTSTQSFNIWIPSDKRATIATLATKLQQLDMPSQLVRKSNKHAEIAAAWINSSFKTYAMPMGENQINVILMIPRYSSTDPSDEKSKAIAWILNKDLDARIQEILEAQLDEGK